MDEKKRGQPLIYETSEDLDNAIQEYYKECDDNTEEVVNKEGVVVKVKKPLIPTIAGLAYALKVDRHTIYNYEKRNDYFHTIKRARDYIFSRIENKLANSNGNVTGPIFLAKNYGYTDKQTIEVNEKIKKEDLDELDTMFGASD